MKIKDIYLCIHYRKRICMAGIFSEMQPGDTEISYLSDTKRYAFIGFSNDEWDDYGELCFATDDKNEAKQFMKDNNLKLDGKDVRGSELLDFHANFEIDKVGQWKMLSLDGTFEK